MGDIVFIIPTVRKQNLGFFLWFFGLFFKPNLHGIHQSRVLKSYGLLVCFLLAQQSTGGAVVPCICELPCSSQINEAALTCMIHGTLHGVREHDYPEVLAMLLSFKSEF